MERSDGEVVLDSWKTQIHGDRKLQIQINIKIRVEERVRGGGRVEIVTGSGGARIGSSGGGMNRREKEEERGAEVRILLRPLSSSIKAIHFTNTLLPLLTTTQPKSTPHSSIPNLTSPLYPLPSFLMGCFLSTQIPRTQQSSSPHLKNNKKPNQQPISKSPPQPSPDITESVKEVLSETPKPKPLAKLNPTKKTPSFDKPRWESFKPSSDDIVSDYSSSCFGDTSFEKGDTIAANAAATTNTINPVKPNSGSPMRNPKKGSYSGELNRENAVTGRSPVRRLDPSPGWRNEGGTGNGNGLRRNAHSGIDPGKGTGSGSGSGSARRSRSPGTRTTEVGCGGGGSIGGDGGNLGRSQSGRKRGSPGKIRLVGGGDKSGNGSGGGSGKWGGGMPNESLENPLVSLECFIFL
ncbi:hypothetical protein Droror1_Dr00016497 [Drosera rotundifolia]